MKKILILICLSPLMLLAQKPFINSVSPTHVEVGQTVNIAGSFLDGSRVFFGGVEATIISSVNSLLRVEVPAGATHGVITVLNNGLSVQSSQQFFISFGGSDITNYDPEIIISSTQNDSYDICMCDLNADFKNDIVMVHRSLSDTAIEMSIYQNTTMGYNTFVSNPPIKINNIENGQGAVAVTCRDLNNDGNPELVYSANSGEYKKEVFVYENQSTAMGTINMVYNPDASLSLPQTTDAVGNNINRIPRKVKISDIDGDGKQDIVVGNIGDGAIHIFRGNGDLTFNPPNEISIKNAPSTGVIALADLNNDSRPDIVITPFRGQNTKVYILRNTSSAENISFELEAGITSPSVRLNMALADFDEDGKIDLITTDSRLQAVSIHKNISSGNEIIYDVASNIPVAGIKSKPWGVDIGDMNGDGKPDVIIGSVFVDETKLLVLENNSSSGRIEFHPPTEIATTSTNQNLCVGDLNNDGKPDIAFTHSIKPGTPASVGVFLNRNCIEPVIKPDGYITCQNEDFTLSATNAVEGTYTWRIENGNGSVVSQSGNEANLNLTSAGNIRIFVEINGQTRCTSTESEVSVMSVIGSKPSPPSFRENITTICTGDNYTIEALGGPYAEFEWTKPDGLTTLSNSPMLPIINVSQINAGTYTVRARTAGGCFSDESADLNLLVNQSSLMITSNDSDDFCAGSFVTLQVSDLRAEGFTYKWKKNNVDLTEIIGNVSSISVDQVGNYTVEATDAEGCTTRSAPYPIKPVSPPESNVDGPAETCMNFSTIYTATRSTGQPGFDLQYSWKVDGSPVTSSNPQELVISFSSVGSHTIELTASYDPNKVESCSDVQTFDIVVSAAQSITFNQPNLTTKCQADPINVGLSEPSANNISTYNWILRNAETNEMIPLASSGASLDVNTPSGVDSVWVIVDITTIIGCQVRDSIKVRNLPSDVDIELPDMSVPDEISLKETNTVSLSALNVTDVRWTPGEIMSDSTSQTVTVFPNQPLTTVTLIGIDMNGCKVSSQIDIKLDNLRPKRTFSPNDDGMNDCWEILNSSQKNTKGCKVYVFDSRGRNIFVGDAPFEDNCVWDGNSSGSAVPEGVYYFVLKCNNNNVPSKSGSILLAR